MAGTKEGAAKMRETMIKKHGGEAKYREYMANKGAKGGKNGNHSWLSADTNNARISGAKGGNARARKLAVKS